MALWWPRRADLSIIPNAVLFIAAAISVAVLFSASLPFTLVPRLSELAAMAGSLAFASAAVLVFFRSRIAYGIAIAAGLLFLPWVVETEVALRPWNPWTFLNYSGPARDVTGTQLTFMVRMIVSVALITIAACCGLFALIRWK